MEEDALCKSFLQSHLFLLDGHQDLTSQEKASKLRNASIFFHGLCKKKKISEMCYQILSSLLNLEYAAVVDSMDKQLGLNSYNELLEPLISEKENGKHEWQSSLSIEAGKNMKEKSQNVDKMVTMKFSKEPYHGTSSTQSSTSIFCRKTQERKNFYADEDEIKPRITQSDEKLMPTFGKRKSTFQPVEVEREEKKRISSTEHPSRLLEINHKPVFNHITSHVKNHNNEKFKEPNEEIEEESSCPLNPFRTAGQQLSINDKNKGRNTVSAKDYGSKKKSLGTRRTGVHGKFIPPISRDDMDNKGDINRESSSKRNDENRQSLDGKYEQYDWMKNIDNKMIELIENEIMDNGPQIGWDDIAGLEFAKKTIQEIVIWPMLRPDIFTGLRGPPKGLLLFGPPGTGKTLIGKCIASQSKATFFTISASSLTSKWVGEGEKMVRALFGVARCHQPAVIFIDEIDSLLIHRSDNEHESSRRIKTEFLVQLDGATCTSNERLLVVGATNRPQELDEAARRRLVKRLYIPLPEDEARRQIVVNLLDNQSHDITENDLRMIAKQTEGFSGADMASLCREAALGPIRSIADIQRINADDVRPVNLQDFQTALLHVRPSVSKDDLNLYINWNRTYGSGGECC